MKKSQKILAVCLIACLLIPNALGLNHSASSFKTDVLPKTVSKLLSFIYPEKESYGMPDVDFHNLSLGTALPVYEFSSGELTLSNVEYYPIFEGNTVVAVAAVGYTEGSAPSVDISNSFASKLQDAVSRNASDENAAYALVSDVSHLYLLSDGALSELEDYTNLISEGTVSAAPLSPAEIASGLPAGVSYAVLAPEAALSVDTDSPASARFAQPFAFPDQTYLSVQVKLQGDYPICWAASAASIGQYKTEISYTAMYVALETTGYPHRATTGDAASALRDLYSLNPTVAYGSPSFTSIQTQLYSYNNPIYSRFFGWIDEDDYIDHAMVMRAYSVFSDDPTYAGMLSYMDPEQTQWRAGTIAHSGAIQTVFGSTTTMLEDYILLTI